MHTAIKKLSGELFPHHKVLISNMNIKDMCYIFKKLYMLGTLHTLYFFAPFQYESSSEQKLSVQTDP